MKRFSDTSRFQEPWYRTLPVALKMAWEYLWANCDNAGVWHPDLALAEFQIGAKVKWDDLIAKTGRIIRLADEKWLIRGFVEVQCGETFSADSRPHKAVMALLQRHGIPLTDRLSIDYSRTTGSPKDKDKDTDTEKDPQSGVEMQEEGRANAIEIYEAYPRKVGRLEALKHIRTALGLVPFAALLERTQAYALATGRWPPAEHKYIPHPERWFRKGCWNDDPQTWEPQKEHTNGKSSAHIRTAADREFDRTGLREDSIPTRLL